MYAYLRLKKGTAFANKMEAERPNIVNRKYGGYQEMKPNMFDWNKQSKSMLKVL